MLTQERGQHNMTPNSKAACPGQEAIPRAPEGDYFYLGILFTPKLPVMDEERLQLFANMQGLKKLTPNKAFRRHLDVQVVCSGNISKLRMRTHTKNGLNPGKHETKPISRMDSSEGSRGGSLCKV